MKCNIPNSTSDDIRRLQDGGIPSALMVNIPIWLVLTLAFCWLHGKSGQRRNRLKLNKVSSEEASQSLRTPLISSHASLLKNDNSAQDESNSDNKKSLPSFSSFLNPERLGEDTIQASPQESTPEDGAADHFFVRNNGILNGILPIIKLPVDQVLLSHGSDAYHYLIFLKTLLRLSVFILIISISISLPINYSGSENYGGFASTTIENIAPGSHLIWGHVVVLAIFSLVCFVTLSRFSSSTMHTSLLWDSNGTLMISNISRNITDADTIASLFKQAYPNTEVINVQFAYDVKEAEALFKKLRDKKRKLQHYEAIFEKGSGTRPMIRRPFWCFGTKVDAIRYYTGSVSSLEKQLQLQRERMQKRTAGVAFVQVRPLSDAQSIVINSQTSKSTLLGNPNTSSWTIKHAPLPMDINWSSLAIRPGQWWSRFLLINFFFFIFLLFWTTPLSILSSLTKLSQTDAFDSISESTASSSWLVNYLPTFILRVLTVVLPILVSLSAKLERHRTKSNLQIFVIRKLFIYLLLSVLILPSMLLTSLDAFIESTLRNETSILENVECVFLPDNGAFFISYLSATVFILVPFQMLRLFDWIMFRWQMWRAVTPLDRKLARKHISPTFDFSGQYAETCTVFALMLVFSTTCPILTIFGAVYFAQKYFVDKYHLVQIVTPMPESGGSNDKMVQIAINFILADVLLMLAFSYGYFVLKLGAQSSETVFTLALLVLVVMLCVMKFLEVRLIGFAHDASEFINSSSSSYKPYPSETSAGLPFARNLSGQDFFDEDADFDEQEEIRTTLAKSKTTDEVSGDLLGEWSAIASEELPTSSRIYVPKFMKDWDEFISKPVL